jgi:trk system potassium uptake protein TrkA
MRIVIVGAGVVGQNLAEELVAEDHDITIVDRSPAVVQRLAERLDVFALQGDGGSPRLLEEAGFKKADMVIAVTDSDHLNMFICLLADTMGVSHKLARVRTEEYSQPQALKLIQRKLSIDRMINPEGLVVDHITKIIAAPGATNAHELAGGTILLHTFTIHAGVRLAGHQLKDVRSLLPEHPFLIVSLIRNGTLIIPGGEDEIRAGDRVHVVMANETLPKFLPLVERRRLAEVERAFVFDGGLLGLAITRQVEQTVGDVVVFEPDPGRARRASLALERSLVVKGSPTEVELLREYDIRTCHLFVAAAEDEEANVMAALNAKRHGARKVIAVTRKRSNVPLLESTGIDVVIEPKMLTVSEILTHLRGDRVLSVARLEGDAEAVELLASRSAPIVGKPLREVQVPKGMLIGAIIHQDQDGRVEVPGGDSVVNPLDKVIVFTLPNARAKAEALVSPGA